MVNKINYIVKDSLCEKAIEDFRSLSSVSNWLILHNDLYNSITIKPEALPRITISHFEDQVFSNIQMFSRLFEIVSTIFNQDQI